MRFFGAAVFGVLALVATLYATLSYTMFGPFTLLGAMPLWMLFIVCLVRAARP